MGSSELNPGPLDKVLPLPPGSVEYPYSLDDRCQHMESQSAILTRRNALPCLVK